VHQLKELYYIANLVLAYRCSSLPDIYIYIYIYNVEYLFKSNCQTILAKANIYKQAQLIFQHDKFSRFLLISMLQVHTISMLQVHTISMRQVHNADAYYPKR